jgi:hypothetical protein
MILEDQVRLAVGIGWGRPVLTPRDIAQFEAIVRVVIKAFTPREDALERSVKLQSHYAELLNMHDGGQRLQFASADAWLARLAKLYRAEGTESNREVQP